MTQVVLEPETQSLPSPVTAGPRSIADIVADLKKPIPDRLLAERIQAGQKIKYIPWYTATRFLDHYAPGWSGRITHILTTEQHLVLTYELSIPASDGVFVRTATGNEELVVKGYGDPASNAESMAFRRAAAKFGLGLYLYNKV